jgi:hypothetical protein
MCPACIATAAWIASGSVSAGGLTLFAFKKLQIKRKQTDKNLKQDK